MILRAPFWLRIPRRSAETKACFRVCDLCLWGSPCSNTHPFNSNILCRSPCWQGFHAWRRRTLLRCTASPCPGQSVSEVLQSTALLEGVCRHFSPLEEFLMLLWCNDRTRWILQTRPASKWEPGKLSGLEQVEQADTSVASIGDTPGKD